MTELGRSALSRSVPLLPNLEEARRPKVTVPENIWSAIRRLSELDGFLMAIGGSAMSTLATPTSDFDLFVVYGSDRALATAKSRIRHLHQVDLEALSHESYRDLCQAVSEFEVPITVQPPPFTFWDLRFLSRLSLGKILVDWEVASDLLPVATGGLVRAIGAFYASSFAVRYQDAVGLSMQNRHQELLLVSGELCQIACCLALSQLGLFDPAPKWAPRLAWTSPHPLVARAAETLVKHIACYETSDPQWWMLRLLNLLNAVVASAILSARGERLHSAQDASGTRFASSREWLEEGRGCVLGLPGYLVVFDTVSSRLQLANFDFIRGVAYCASA